MRIFAKRIMVINFYEKNEKYVCNHVKYYNFKM